MLKHNLLIVFRNFKRNKSTFFINLIGLSTGLACALLIYLWVNDELHVDKFHKNDSQLYQVMENVHYTDRIITQSYTPDLLAKTMAQEMPEVKYAASVTPSSWLGFTLSVDNKNFKALGQFAGKNFFNIFSFNLVQGNPDQVISGKNTVAISEELAKKLFHTTDNVIGKTIEWQTLNYKNKAVVSGVFRNVPENSTMQFDFVLSYDQWFALSKAIGRTITWGNSAPNTYIVLKKTTDVKNFKNKIAGFIKVRNKYSNISLFVRPYSDGYLFNKYEDGVQAGGRIEYVRLFSLIAIFILLVACINFMNLSTAKSTIRMKEVGIKKTIGAERKSLIAQFMGESIIISFISMVFGIALVELFLPQFNSITGKHLFLDFNKNIIISFLGITLFTGVIAGSYPALYLSKFNPVSILKGKSGGTSKGVLWIRKGLVVFQFTLSIILIAAVFIIYKQMKYIQTKNLGYNRDNIISFNEEGNAAQNQDAFLKRIKMLSGVVNASSISTNLMGSLSATSGIDWEGKSPKDDINFEVVDVNYNLIETLGIKFKEGRSFSEKYGSDYSSIIFNQAAIDIMGLKNPVGKTVKLWGKEKKIIGVAKNFNFESLHEKIKPLFFVLNPGHTLEFMVRLKAGKEKVALNNIKKFYSEFNPGFTFNYKFLDQDYQELYASEERVSILSKYFAGMAIIISCLGLFGLGVFTSQRRYKEIGVRKILGSSEFGIIYLLSADFTKLVIASIIIALPLSYYLVKSWLDSFAYRIHLSLWYFVMAGAVTLIIAWLTVGTQAFKAARINPAQCLRDE